MSAKRWAAAVAVVISMAFAGQALAGTDLRQTFKAAKQNGENLVEVLKLALQSGANLTEVAAAANDAGISADIVTAAALAAGQQPPTVARAVEQGSDSRLGYLEPAVTKPLMRTEATSEEEGSLVLAQKVGRMRATLAPCPPENRCNVFSGAWCCTINSSDLFTCYVSCK